LAAALLVHQLALVVISHLGGGANVGDRGVSVIASRRWYCGGRVVRDHGLDEPQVAIWEEKKQTG
jgi:hypothetical protein